MLSDRNRREDELAGKTLLIMGLGRIGTRLARLARAFEMHVIGLRRNPEPQHELHLVAPVDRIVELLPKADFVALTCPLTPETEGMIGAAQFDAMTSSAFLINVVRGRVVNEVALIEALQQGRIAGAGLDTFYNEPLPRSSPLSSMPNVLVTPHTASETRAYEESVIDIVLENLGRLWLAETALKNQIV